MAHILIVEDEEQIAQLVRDALAAAGYTVSIAADGLAGLRMLETQAGRPGDPGLDAAGPGWPGGLPANPRAQHHSRS